MDVEVMEDTNDEVLQNAIDENVASNTMNEEAMQNNRLLVTNGKVLYLVVRQAFRGSQITFTPGNSSAVLVWCDTVKIEYFKQLFPWQVINCIPWAQTMCRKAPFVRLIQRVMSFYPELYNFLPISYILPYDKIQFYHELRKQEKTFIYKPDKGSLGHGIRLITPGSEFHYHGRLAICQEYVESFTIDQKKFDLRIYALICSLSPLSIYIFRGGVARFCTETADGETKYSILTNTAVNSKNPNMIPDKMTRMIDDVFQQLANEGHDVDKIWEEIDQTIVLSIISAYGFLKKEEGVQCPNYGMSRCFQIIGCDILLDKYLHPYILEINYRPSMKCNTKNSHDMKLEMLKHALKIAAPFQPLQNLLDNTEYPKDPEGYIQFMKQNKNVIDEIEALRAQNEKGNRFEKVYPNPNKPIWDHVLKTVMHMPTETALNTGIPLSIEVPTAINNVYNFPQNLLDMKAISKMRAQMKNESVNSNKSTNDNSF